MQSFRIETLIAICDTWDLVAADVAFDTSSSSSRHSSVASSERRTGERESFWKESTGIGEFLKQKTWKSYGEQGFGKISQFSSHNSLGNQFPVIITKNDL